MSFQKHPNVQQSIFLPPPPPAPTSSLLPSFPPSLLHVQPPLPLALASRDQGAILSYLTSSSYQGAILTHLKHIILSRTQGTPYSLPCIYTPLIYKSKVLPITSCAYTPLIYKSRCSPLPQPSQAHLASYGRLPMTIGRLVGPAHGYLAFSSAGHTLLRLENFTLKSA